MKRRSVRWGYLVFGGFLLFATLAFFTQVIVPVERFSLDFLGATLFRYHQFSDSLTPEPILTTETSFRIIGKRSDEFSDIMLMYPPQSPGRRVLAEGKVLIGTIIERGSQASRVQLVSSPFVRTAAVFGRPGIPVTLEGKGAGLLEARLPRGSDIQISDVAYVDEGDILLIGPVVRIIDMPGDPLLTILVRQPVNLTTLNTVFIHGF